MKTNMNTKNCFSILLASALALCGGAAWAKGVAGPSVDYYDWDEGTKALVLKSCTEYEVVTNETATFEDGKWYVVNAAVENATGGIVVDGSAHLILADGAELKVTGDRAKRSAGIEVSSYKSLAIYGQKENSGRLIATGTYYGAGIGGGATDTGSKKSAGTITINGGTVEARGFWGAAIGGAHNCNGGPVTVNGGIVRAQGSTNFSDGYSAGIGGGMRGQGGTVKINGGDVTASGASAIGPTDYGGDHYNPGTIEFAETLMGEVLVGSASNSAMLMFKADYAENHLAGYMHFPSVGIVIPQMTGVSCTVSDGTEAVPPISYNGFISYCTTNHATLTAAFAAAQGYRIVQEAPVNPKTVEDVVGITTLTAADLPVVKSQVQLVLEDIFDADNSGTVVEAVYKSGKLNSHTVTLGRDYGPLAFSNDFGKVTLDLNGWSIRGVYGADSATGLTSGGNGGAAIVVNGNCGAAMGTTALTVANDTAAADGRPAAGSGADAGIIGGNGGVGMPPGRGSEAIVNGSGVKVAATGPAGLVKKGENGAASGTAEHPWKVGVEGAEDTVQAYLNGTGKVIVTGAGTPKEFAAGEEPWTGAVPAINEIIVPSGKVPEFKEKWPGSSNLITDGTIPYLDWDAENKVMTNAVCTAYTVVTPEMETFADGGWYVTRGVVENLKGIKVSGDAHLILCDDAALTVKQDTWGQAGIVVGVTGATTNSLTIYGQSAGTGALETTGYDRGAGIGGGYQIPFGIVTINGGKVKAQGGSNAAGIGGGGNAETADGNLITINGGSVIATGGHIGAGIGGAEGGDGGIVTINGGIVTATGDWESAGIGGGQGGDGGTVTINGGMVTATGDRAAGVGGGVSCDDQGTVTFGPGFKGGVAAGENAEKAVFWMTTAYTNDHSAKFVSMPASALAITNVAGVVYTVKDGDKAINPNAVDGVSYYVATNHATLTAGFAAAQGYRIVQDAPENPKTVEDVVDIMTLTAADLPIVKSLAQVALEGIFDTANTPTVIELMHGADGAFAGYKVILGKDYGPLAFSNDFGAVTIDLNGWSISGAAGANGSAVDGGTAGGAAVTIDGTCGATLGATAITVIDGFHVDAEGFDTTGKTVDYSTTFIPGDYCVVDLATGAVTEYKDVIDGSIFNTDEYKTTKMAFRYVPAGKFKAESCKTFGYVNPHAFNDVTLSAYWIAVFPLTEAQYNAIMGGETTDILAKESLSWNTVRGNVGGACKEDSYVGKLNQLPNLGSIRFELCTSLQWERAVRAGTRTNYFFTDTLAVSTDSTDKILEDPLDPSKSLSTYAWYAYNCPTPGAKPVGEKLPNAWGIYDACGNVVIKCLDRHSTNPPDGQLLVDYSGPASGSTLVIRGGCSNSSAGHTSSIARSNVYATSADVGAGFRLVLTGMSPVVNRPISGTGAAIVGGKGGDGIIPGNGSEAIVNGGGEKVEVEDAFGFVAKGAEGLTYVAQIVTAGGAAAGVFTSLQDAFDSELLDDPAVTNTVKVLQNVTLQGPIGLPICDGEGGLTNATARLDLNGKTITVPTGSALMTVASGATVIIDDSSAEGTGVIEKAEPMGEFDWTAMIDMAVVSVFEGGKLTLANGTLKSAPEWQDEAPEGQYDSVGVVNFLGEFTMTGGAIVAKDAFWTGDKIALYSYGDNMLTGGKVKDAIRFESDEEFGSMSISGGVFGMSDVFDHPDWVAEGYACDENADAATFAEGYPWAVFFATDGSKWNPWNVGPEGSELPQAYTNRNGELVIEGAGTVVEKPWLNDGVKEVVNAIAVKNPETELPEGAFEGLGSDDEKIELKLPDGWQGELPDESGNWYGGKVKITTWPYIVRNVRFQQRYPWNGLVDITADVYGPEDTVRIIVSATKGLEALPVSTLEGESTAVLVNGLTQVKFVWNADADVGPQAARLENVRVKVTQTLLEADVDSAVLVERTEPGVTLDENAVVVGAKCDGDGCLEIPVKAKGLAKGVLANPEIRVVNFLNYRTAINLHAWDKSGFSATDVPAVQVGGSVPAGYYRDNVSAYANIGTAIAYHWLTGVEKVRSVPLSKCEASGESEAGWLDLAKGTVRVARDSELITVDPAWGGATVANVGWPGEDTDRSYTAAAKETWDVTAVEGGRRYDFSFKAEKGPDEVLAYAASFWKLGDGWEVLDHATLDTDTRLDGGTTYLVIGENEIAEGVRLVVPNDTRFVFDEGSGFRPAADSAIVAPAYAQVTNDVTGIVTLKLLPQPVVANMKFRQRYPWNGIVDITFDLSTDQDTEAAPIAAAYNAKLSATVNGKSVVLKTARTEDGTVLTEGVFRVQTGKVRVIWDAAADLPDRPKGELRMKVDVSVGDL